MGFAQETIRVTYFSAFPRTAAMRKYLTPILIFETLSFVKEKEKEYRVNQRGQSSWTAIIETLLANVHKCFLFE